MWRLPVAGPIRRGRCEDEHLGAATTSPAQFVTQRAGSFSLNGYQAPVVARKLIAIDPQGDCA